MKISIASDLHLEFGDIELRNQDQAQVLILSGDILVAQDLTQVDPHQTLGPEYRNNRLHRFMQQVSAEFEHVIYVMGNHEHYHGDFAQTHQHLCTCLAYLPNIHVLERQRVDIDGVTFIGGTLWTDMNRRDPLTLYHMTSMMNDFRCVNNSRRQVSYRSYDNLDKPVGMTDQEWLALPSEQRMRTVFRTRPAKFTPDDAVFEHEHMLEYIRLITEGHWDERFVVVGHHAPSAQSVHSKYGNDSVMNGGYFSNLDEFILDHPQIRLWTHGHTHEDFDYMIGTTRVVCNPRGYAGHEPRTATWQLKTVEI